jgi:hypothetical protein
VKVKGSNYKTFERNCFYFFLLKYFLVNNPTLTYNPHLCLIYEYILWYFHYGYDNMEVWVGVGSVGALIYLTFGTSFRSRFYFGFLTTPTRTCDMTRFVHTHRLVPRHIMHFFDT